MSSDLVLATFIDFCCARYVRDPEYRRKLAREADKPKPRRAATTNKTARRATQ